MPCGQTPCSLMLFWGGGEEETLSFDALYRVFFLDFVNESHGTPGKQKHEGWCDKFGQLNGNLVITMNNIVGQVKTLLVHVCLLSWILLLVVTLCNYDFQNQFLQGLLHRMRKPKIRLHLEEIHHIQPVQGHPIHHNSLIQATNQM